MCLLGCFVVGIWGFNTRPEPLGNQPARISYLVAMAEAGFSNLFAKDFQIFYESVSVDEQFAILYVPILFKSHGQWGTHGKVVFGDYHHFVVLPSFGYFPNRFLRDAVKRRCFSERDPSFHDSRWSRTGIFDITGIEQILWYRSLEFILGTRASHPCSFRIDESLGIQQGSFGGIFGNFSLQFKDRQSPVSKSNAQDTNEGQQCACTPQEPISPIARYRHGGKFADSYGFACIWGGFIVSGFLITFRLLRQFDRPRRNLGDWLLISSCIILDFISFLSGGIGCLPWDWSRCLCNGQPHNQNQVSHGDSTLPLRKGRERWNLGAGPTQGFVSAGSFLPPSRPKAIPHSPVIRRHSPKRARHQASACIFSRHGTCHTHGGR